MAYAGFQHGASIQHPYHNNGYAHQSAQRPQPDYEKPQSQPTQPGYGQHAPPEVNDSGNYQGMEYTIKHRNTNSTLTIRLNQGDLIKGKPGAMIHMSPTITLQGAVKFSFKKLFTGGEMSEASYQGPGVVTLAPMLMGDIVTLPIDEHSGSPWLVGKDHFLACTSGVKKDTKAQSASKTLFSGEDLFVYQMIGQGMAWLSSYGAVDSIQLQEGDQHIVDNGHLVAWNCAYAIEKAGGGKMHSIKSGEGLVCRFTGPGTIYYQTRNLDDFASWIRSQTSS